MKPPAFEAPDVHDNVSMVQFAVRATSAASVYTKLPCEV